MYDQLGDDFGLADALTRQGHFLLERFYNKEKAEEVLTIYRQVLATRRRLGGEIGIARALHGISNAVTLASNDLDEIEALQHEALALGRRAGDRLRVSTSLTTLSNVACHRGDIDAARHLVVEAIQIGRKIGPAFHVAGLASGLLLALCFYDTISDQLVDAEQRLQEALRIEVRDTVGVRVFFAVRKTWICLARGDLADAEQSMKDVIDVVKVDTEHFKTYLIDEVPLAVGFIAAGRGQPERGLVLASISLNHPRMGKGLANSPLVARHLDAIRAQLTPDDYAAAWERGKNLDVDTAIQELIATYDDLDV
jgi:ATP/maltotriose-dependent transcriptional regulator MalT